MRMFNYERLSDDIKIAVSSDHTFGTDAVILSDFAKIKPRDKALDMGTGCGIIPLLWLRNEKINNVSCLDIQKNAYEQVCHSIEINHLEDRLKPFNCDLRKINEIFYSLQGEGYHTGTPAVFIRFSGCNLKCSFCDTRHEEGVLMSDDEIIAEVGKYPAVTVILTGGEPSLWVDEAFIDRLHQAGKYVCIETNGTNPLPPNIDWVTCSPKQGVKLGITRMDEVKVVYEGQDIGVYELLPAEYFFLQPCSCSNTAETVACVMQHPKWRLSLQTHKLIDIR